MSSKPLSPNDRQHVNYGVANAHNGFQSAEKQPLTRKLALCGLCFVLLVALLTSGIVYSTRLAAGRHASLNRGKYHPNKFRMNAAITTYPSRYMNATNTPLTTLENGAVVGEDTAAYFNLPINSPKRTSYDTNLIKTVDDGVWCIGSPGVINVNVVEGPNGLIVLDTGESYEEGEHFYSLLRNETQTPIRAIIYTHDHPVNGAQAFIDGDRTLFNNTDILVIGNPNVNESRLKRGGMSLPYPEVMNVLMGRIMEQNNVYLPRQGPDAAFKNVVDGTTDGFVPVNTPVENNQTMTVAGLELHFFTENVITDSKNQLLTWIPEKKILLNNILWGWFPNMYSARGGSFRDPMDWIKAVDFARTFPAEILLGTHSVAVKGTHKIRRRLRKYRDGIAYIVDQTLKGILLGEGPDELRYSVKLPPQFLSEPSLIENYGEMSVMVPRIFDATFGPFNRNAARMNKLHPQEEAERMVIAMGGQVATRRKARTAFNDGDYLWSCQIADYLVKAYDNRVNRRLKAKCLRQMGYRALSTNSRSWYLTQARELEGQQSLQKVPASEVDVERNTADYVSYYRVRINGERASAVDQLLGVKFAGRPCYGLHIRDGVVEFIPDVAEYEESPDVIVGMSLETWVNVYNNLADPVALIDDGQIIVPENKKSQAKFLFSLFDQVYVWS